MATNQSLGYRQALGLVLIAGLACSGSASSAGQRESPVSVGQAAGIGALLGLALGSDPIVATVQGAALGAAGGLIANAVIEGSERSEDRKAEQQRAEQASPQASSENLDSEIEQAIGSDNYEGYKALRSCQHARASALAKAGATSSDEDHRITSFWLEAMIAVDQRDSAAAEAFFAQIVEQDPDIDTVQQASIETDKVILDMRRERRSLDVSCR